MASNVAKFLLLLLTSLAVGILVYVSEYRNISMTFQPMSSLLPNEIRNTKRVDDEKHVFHVDSYSLVDDMLEMNGFYKTLYESEANTSHTDRLALKIEGLSDLINRLKPHILSDQKLVKAKLSGAKYFKSSRTVRECNCNTIFRNNQTEIVKAKTMSRTKDNNNFSGDYIKETKNCSDFITKRAYITSPLTQVEKDFPIAFSILMYTAPEQTERLLRSIYRPQNIYCIHVDEKSERNIYDTMVSIANCFDNVFVSEKRFDVQWGTMTVLEPDLQCMSELYNTSKTWKYFINLTGQEFPLRTNYELVQILKAYNGSNDIDGTRSRANANRWQAAGDPPHKIIPSKGSLHIVASRGYVDFVLNDQRAKDFLEWCRKVQIPDEVFFSSLQHNPHLRVPGSYTGVPETFSSDSTIEKPFVARFKNWGDSVFNWPCNGKRVRLVCVLGVGDLPLLATRKELFVNKIHYDFEPMTFECLEELNFNHTRDIYLGKLAFDSQWYRNLGFVKNKVN